MTRRRVRAITRSVGENGRKWIAAPGVKISDGKMIGLRAERMRPEFAAAVRTREEIALDMRMAARDKTDP